MKLVDDIEFPTQFSHVVVSLHSVIMEHTLAFLAVLKMTSGHHQSNIILSQIFLSSSVVRSHLIFLSSYYIFSPPIDSKAIKSTALVEDVFSSSRETNLAEDLFGEEEGTKHSTPSARNNIDYIQGDTSIAPIDKNGKALIKMDVAMIH